MKASTITSSKYFIPVALFLLCFLLYGNTLPDKYAFDDTIYTTENSLILKGFSAFRDIFDKGSLYGIDKNAVAEQYRPLILLSFMTEVSIFGLNPHISHFFNVLFFALTVVLLYFFLRKILKNYTQSIAIAATLLFAFHPIHTEVVANIKSRDEIVCFLFGLLSFYFLLQQEPKWQGRFMNRPYIISLLAFFTALFCKETALTFVAVIPLLLYFLAPEGEHSAPFRAKKIILKTIPYMVLVGIYLFIRSRVLPSMTFAHVIPISDNALMAAKTNADSIATSFVLIGKYIYMLFIPYPLSWDYSFNQIPVVSWRNSKPILSLLVCGVLIGYAIWNIKRKSIFSFSILFFFITLSLSCNLIVKIAATFAERFLYVPSLAFCIALPILTLKTLERLKIQGEGWKKQRSFLFNIQHSTFSTIIACILIIYTIIVIPRNAQWKNNFTLCSAGVITSPNSVRAHWALACIYWDTAQISNTQPKRLKYATLAAHEFKKSIELESWTEDPGCYFSLGVCYNNMGEDDSAIMAFKKSLQLDPQNVAAANDIGFIYLNKKQYDKAIPIFLNSTKNAPDIIPLLNLVICYQKEGNFIMALHYDSLILQRDPGYIPTLHDMAVTHNNMGVDFLKDNNFDKALIQFTTALTIDPTLDVAFKNMALVYYKKGDMAMAKKYAQMAAQTEQENRRRQTP